MSLIVTVVPIIGNNSTMFPKHPFKLGFFNSSYDPMGFESMLYLRAGKGMRYILRGSEEEDGKELTFIPDWKKVIERGSEVMALLDQSVLKHGWFKVKQLIHPVGEHQDNQKIVGAREAVKHYNRRIDQCGNSNMGCLTDISSIIYLQNVPTFLGIVAGIEPVDQKPCSYVILSSREEESVFYFEGIGIIIETAEWILNQMDPQKYSVRWSA